MKKVLSIFCNIDQDAVDIVSEFVATVKEKDEVVVHINSNGGCTNSALVICNLLNQLKNKKSIINYAMVASCAVDIFLCFEDRYSFITSRFMIHNSSYSLIENVGLHEIKSYTNDLKFANKVSNDLLKKVVSKKHYKKIKKVIKYRDYEFNSSKGLKLNIVTAIIQ